MTVTVRVVVGEKGDPDESRSLVDRRRSLRADAGRLVALRWCEHQRHQRLPGHGNVAGAGVEITVAGEHADENGQCSGSVKVQLEGGAFDSPLTAVSLAGTALTGFGVAVALRPLFRRVV